MKFSTKDIVESLHKKGCHPTKTNFRAYCNGVEEFILENCGHDRENITKKSLSYVHKTAENFTKSCRDKWQRYKQFDRYVQYFTNDLEIDIALTRKSLLPPSSETASTASETPKTSTTSKRADKKDFEQKSDRAQYAQSAKIRTEYPSGAISLAARQVLRSSGNGDASFVMKRMADEPTTAPKKARKALDFDEPGKSSTMTISNQTTSPANHRSWQH